MVCLQKNASTQLRGDAPNRVESSRVEPACPKAAPLGRRETTTANLTSTFTTSATKIQQRNPYVPAIHLSALLLCYILPSISIGSTFVFASRMCSLVFQFLPVPSSMPEHVSTNGCLEGWQCSLLTSNIVPSISGTTTWRQLVRQIPIRVRSIHEGSHAMGQTNLNRQEDSPSRARPCGIWRPICEGPVCRFCGGQLQNMQRV